MLHKAAILHQGEQVEPEMEEKLFISRSGKETS